MSGDYGEEGFPANADQDVPVLPRRGPIGFLRALFEGLAWEATHSIVEILLFARRGWWWRLQAHNARHYWPIGPGLLALREGKRIRLPIVQLTYGETPPASFVHMLRSIEVTAADRVLDLGCGRGLHLLYAALELNVQVQGVDIISAFIERGRKMAHAMHLEERVQLDCGDFLEMDWSQATVIHIVATTFVQPIRQKMLPRLLQLKAGTWVLTHAWLLPEADFEELGGRDYPCTWGWSSVRFYRKR